VARQHVRSFVGKHGRQLIFPAYQAQQACGCLTVLPGGEGY
jgi:hypothetical protein